MLILENLKQIHRREDLARSLKKKIITGAAAPIPAAKNSRRLNLMLPERIIKESLWILGDL